MCAIPQLVSAPLNPIPIVPHFRSSPPPCEHSYRREILIRKTTYKYKCTPYVRLRHGINHCLCNTFWLCFPYRSLTFLCCRTMVAILSNGFLTTWINFTLAPEVFSKRWTASTALSLIIPNAVWAPALSPITCWLRKLSRNSTVFYWNPRIWLLLLLFSI